MKWSDLSEDEKRFLEAWREAPAEAQWDAFAMLINGRRRDAGDHTTVEDIRVLPHPDTSTINEL